ncbi:unnamed protein product [Cuscuta europaea]|uniref:K-box domain-containing protein n=1 Tax=Cuscuta europaea TaxID=41803 RepID=A0A9P1E637_CUSEU|nr:unnamed protein product [Cuscuta europaea]
MQQVLARQNMQSNKMENLDHRHYHPPIQLHEQDNRTQAQLMKDCVDKDRQLRQLRGEDILELDMDGLITLEKQMERGLSRVLKMKDTLRLNEIAALKNQGAFLKEENEQMKQFVHQQMGRGKKPPSDQLVPGQSDNSISEASSPTNNQCCHGDSDTSLKLGYI